MTGYGTFYNTDEHFQETDEVFVVFTVMSLQKFPVCPAFCLKRPLAAA